MSTHTDSASRARTDLPSDERGSSLDEAPTFTPLRPDVLASPEQVRARQAIEAALFGAPEAVAAVGRFRLLDRLGQGGMGTVYAAYDEQLDRKIAVKLLRPRGLDRERLRERTLREARALARLSHPHVVHVYEVGEIEDELFVAMEYCAGPTLKTWLERDRDWREVARVFGQAGEGLAAAHALGIVHRDFKPHNVMFGGDGRVRVLDFGLARLEQLEQLELELEDTARKAVNSTDALTCSGMLLGTPAYMAPEQLLRKTADARSDQFGFCAALYEGLYGERPFAGETLTQLIAAVANARVRGEPAGTSVPTWLRKIVLRGLSPHPGDRFASMRELLDALADDPRARRRKKWGAAILAAGLLGGASWGVTQTVDHQARVCEGMEVKLAGVWDEARRAEVEAVLLATGVNYAPDTWTRVEARLDDYTTQWVAARVAACEATQRGEQSGELLDLRMACLDERLTHVKATVDVLAGADATVVAKAVQSVSGLPSLSLCADVDALRLEVPPPEDSEVAARVIALDEVLAEARALQNVGKYEEGLERANAAATEAETLAYEPLTIRAWLHQGELRSKLGEYDEAVATLKQAFEQAVGLRMTAEAATASTKLMALVGGRLARHEEGRQWEEFARPLATADGTDAARARFLVDRALLASSEGEYGRARDDLENAIAILERTRGPEHPYVALCLNNLGIQAKDMGDYERAREDLERAFAIREATLGPQHPDLGQALDGLGSVAIAEGDYEQARHHLEHALAIHEAAFGPQHLGTVSSLHNLGIVAFRQAKYEQARDYHERALAIKEEALGAKHPRVASSLTNLGNVADAQNDREQARRYYERALAIQEEVFGPDHSEVANTLHNLGNVVMSEGGHDQGRRYHARALAIWEETLGPEHPAVGYALLGLGHVAELVGEHEEARGYHVRALAIWESALGPEHPALTDPLASQGRALVSLGRPGEALPLLERALALGTANEGDPVTLAWTRFVLARALWDAPADQGRDRDRARELAALARDTFVDAGEKSADVFEDVERWLDEHHSS